MSSEYFKYSTTVRGHQSDVRDLCPAGNAPNHFLSASRDMTAKLFAQNDQNEFNEVLCYKGHKKFVACVLYVPPMSNHPDGLVITGSNDHTILVFHPKSSELIGSLKGHTNTVCALSVGKSGTVLSASWDKTARLWRVDPMEADSMVTYTGHAAAVWNVIQMPGENDLVVTASADKSIKVWKEGHCAFTLEGHKDCVRGLSAISNTQFLSCSNDTTVKMWSIEGQCLQTYYGHRSFVYSVSNSSTSSEFLTAGEDRTLRVWNIAENHPKQTIALPATSVWRSIFLKNGDIAASCSDGTVRIFTRSDSRTANPAQKFAFEEELAAAQIPAAENTLQNDVDLDQLPGAEALQQPGKNDGQTRLIRGEDSNIEVYQWSQGDEMWMKVGNMVGSANSREKTKYQGKEYDYVFTIDIEEGKPPLQLPYNMTEDPWVAAQKFIDKHDISQLHLETIANFIIENSQTTGVSGNTSSEFADPFTGGGRYVPGGNTTDGSGPGSDPYTGGGRYIPHGSDAVAGPSNTSSTDPFTGGGRYIPSHSGTITSQTSRNDPLVNPSRYIAGSDQQEAGHERMEVSVQLPENQYFPKDSFVLFETAKLSIILSKLKESLHDEYISDDDINTLATLVEPDHDPKPNEVEILWKVLSGGTSVCFPAIDLFRLALVRKPVTGSIVCSNWAKELLQLLLDQILPDGEDLGPNRLLAVRVLCNLGLSDEGSAFLLAGHDRLLTAFSSSDFTSATVDPKHKHTQTAVATFFINMAVLATRKNPAAIEEHCQKVRMNCIPALLICLQAHGDVTPEAAFRYMVALGTLMGKSTASQAAARYLDAAAIVKKVAASHKSVTKIAECAKYLNAVL